MATDLRIPDSLMRLDSIEEKHTPPATQMAYMTPVLVLVVAIYGRSLVELFRDWWNFPEHSQGLVIVPFALFIAGLHRRSLTSIFASCELRGLLLVAAGC